MIVYDGTYRLQPDAGRGTKPRTRWKCAWRIRIIDLSAGEPTVRHLKPTIVVANQTGSATSLSSCAEAVGRKISRDFNLDVKKVLWIEHMPSSPGQWHAAVFRQRAGFGPDISYSIQWRPLRPNEDDLIKRFGIAAP